jgi:type II secretory pathway pseudopilin PulG
MLSRRRTDYGFSLIEALFATAIVASAFTTATGLLTRTAAANARSRLVTRAAILAAGKMEELQSLVFDVALDGANVDDEELSESPEDALADDRSGYADYFTSAGAPLDADGTRPPGAMFVRRWSVRALDAARDVLALQVTVGTGAGPPLASVTTIRTRRGG